jgi:hypothetical protein
MAPQPNTAGAVDRAQLGRIGQDIGEAALRRYVAFFLKLLARRIERINQVVVGQATDGLSAAVDLQTTSVLLGANRLAAAATDVVTLLRSGEPISPKAMACLRAEAETAFAELQQALVASGRLSQVVQS